MTMGTGAMLVLMSEEARVPLLMVQSSPMTLYRNRRLSGLTHTPGLKFKEEITALEVRLKELFDVVKSDRGSRVCTETDLSFVIVSPSIKGGIFKDMYSLITVFKNKPE